VNHDKLNTRDAQIFRIQNLNDMNLSYRTNTINICIIGSVFQDLTLFIQLKFLYIIQLASYH